MNEKINSQEDGENDNVADDTITGLVEEGKHKENKATNRKQSSVWFLDDPSSLNTTDFRSSDDYDDIPSGKLTFKDHFSLRVNSSTVRFRGARVHVYSSGNEQFLLEDRLDDIEIRDYNKREGTQQQVRGHTITVKRMRLGNFGQVLLRLSYTLVAILLVGVIFALCFVTLFFVFPQLLYDPTGIAFHFRAVEVIGAVLCIPVFLVGMATVMSIGTTFVRDAASGGTLIRSVFGMPPLIMEVLYIATFLVTPLLTFCVALFARTDDPWQLVATVWGLILLAVFLLFGVAILFRQGKACFQLVAKNYVEVDFKGGFYGMMQVAKHAMILSQKGRFSGMREDRFLVNGECVPPEGGFSSNPDYVPVSKSVNIIGHLTQSCLGRFLIMYETLNRPQRLYTTEEIQDHLPFLTKDNWSLEAVCCRGRRKRPVIFAAKGPSAVGRKEMQSAVFCSFVGGVIMVLFVLGLVYWFSWDEMGIWGTMGQVVVLLLGIGFILLPMVYRSFQTYKKHSNMHRKKRRSSYRPKNRDSFVDGGGIQDSFPLCEDETLFQVIETLRVSRPRRWYLYTMTALEIVFFFIFPLIILFVFENTRIGIIFIILGMLTFFLKFFDAGSVLTEIGSLSTITFGSDSSVFQSVKGTRELRRKARLSAIVGEIQRSSSIGSWMCVFGGELLVVFIMVLMAHQQQGTETNALSNISLERDPVLLVSDFFYPPGNASIAYPTCELANDFALPLDRKTALEDYAFLTGVAYKDQPVTERALRQWFGNNVVKDNEKFVEQWRHESNYTSNPTYFKFFTFPDTPNFAVVDIRGSITIWDWIFNGETWASAVLAQTVVKWTLPLGWIWTPILPNIVSLIQWPQSNAIRRNAYYRVVTDFVEDLQNGYNGTNYDTIRLTGHSLGGGIGAITAAQTGAYAVGMSSPTPILSRNTFHPPLTLEQAEAGFFNVLPKRDYVGRIGGRSLFTQEIECRAPKGDPFACHYKWQTVCEIQFKCGSNGRPVLCDCVDYFYFPPPLPINGTNHRTFQEACAAEKELFRLDSA